ncbi:MAG: hypothetical protein SH868_16870 [Bythopirellula sp.]|nr:hypothetical protein [Bythopirellula sp.]
MPNTRAIMFTMTTYGTWLRGDRRGWVDDGIILPPDPDLEAADLRRLKHPIYQFPKPRLHEIGSMIGDSLITRKQIALLALSIGTWHVHYVIGATTHDIPSIAKCAKDAVRWGLRLDRPIWTTDYDKRFCFDDASTRNRVHYVERHNIAAGWPPRPWPFIADVEKYLHDFNNNI